MTSFLRFIKIFVFACFIITSAVYAVYVRAENDNGKRNVRKHWHESTQKILNNMPKEEYDRLKKLQKDDPQAFRKEIQGLAKKYRNKQQKNVQKKEMDDLVFQYHVSQGDEKEKILSKIREKVTEQFNEKMANNRANVEKTGKRLDELKKLLKTREENADKIIKERIEYLTKDPSLKW